MSKCEVFSGPYFSVFGLEKTPYLDTSHTVKVIKNIRTLQKSLYEAEKDLLDPEDITNKLTELDDRSRKNQLCIYGIVETTNDSRENCEENHQKIIKEKLEIKKIIERAGKKQSNRPRTIFAE